MQKFDGMFGGNSEPIDLLSLLAIDQIDENRFRNRCNQRNAYRSLFGGQMIAQALAAADRTVDGRTVHSLHSYFLRSGVDDKPVDFIVERLRDGGRFSHRRIVAEQDDQALFSMECSYRVPIEGYSHQAPSEFGFDPESALDPRSLVDSGRADVEPFMTLFTGRYPIEIRLSGEEGFFRSGPRPKRHYWLRVPCAAGIDDPLIHQQMLAYITDFMLAGAPLVPHTVPLPGAHLFVASLDHSVWFHRPARCDDWLMFETDSPSAEGGVNLARGLVYDRAGRLVASVAQEALQFAVDPSLERPVRPPHPVFQDHPSRS